MDAYRSYFLVFIIISHIMIYIFTTIFNFNYQQRRIFFRTDIHPRYTVMHPCLYHLMYTFYMCYINKVMGSELLGRILDRNRNFP